MKVNIEHFDCKNLFQDFRFMKNIKIAMTVWWNNRRKEVCIKRKICNSIFSVLIFLNIFRCCHVDWCLKFVGFLRGIMEDDNFFNLSPFLGKLVLNSYNIFELIFSPHIFILPWAPFIKFKFILMNNMFIFVFSSFPPFFFL